MLNKKSSVLFAANHQHIIMIQYNKQYHQFLIIKQTKFHPVQL